MMQVKNHVNSSQGPVALYIAILLAITQASVAQSSSNKDLKENSTLQEANNATNYNTVTSQLVSGRSMESKEKSVRGGRMLNLDHLAGDIGKDERAALIKSQSGQRESRILTDDSIIDGKIGPTNKQEGRNKKSKGKKMKINGFIPIVSLEDATKSGKHFENFADSSHEENDEEVSDEDQQDQQLSSVRKEQLLSNYGGQTSIGHASFASPSQVDNNSGQQQSNYQWQQMVPTGGNQDLQEAARARKLVGPIGILNGLSELKRPQQAFPIMQQQQPLLLQSPMNVPPIAIQANFEQTSDCICVPFFQCKNGFLSESQLSRSQLQQIFGQTQQHNTGTFNQHQTPRALNFNQPAQANLAQQPQMSSLISQIELQRQLGSSQAQALNKVNEQQIANDIYDHLRKSIESENLEQQLQQQQQQQLEQPAYLDERSKLGGRQTDSVAANSTISNGQSQEDVQERSLLNPLGRRSGPAKCGIMRTCCKIPQTLMQSYPQQLSGAEPGLFPIRGQHNSRLTDQLSSSSSVVARPPMMQPQPQYQMLQPMRQVHSMHQQQQPHHNNHQDYLPSTSISIPTTIGNQLQPHRQQTTLVESNPLLDVGVNSQQQRPMGSFMAGRCGMRQTIGISGRVQNTQPAPGSESLAEFGEFPSHAAILRRISPGDSLFVCSAVLISNQWLATAAHCVRKHRVEELKVRLGEWDVNRDDEFYPNVELRIRDIVLHPDFQASSLINDIALIRLESPIDGQQMPHISPSCLATPNEQFSGQRCWLTGWGKDAFGMGGSFQSVLRKVDLPVVGRHDCEMALRFQTKLGKFFRLHQSAICAGGERGKDACEGDGGSGLYCTDPESGLTKVIGLVSWGVGCGQRGVPGVYTNLSLFYQWIESVVANSGEESLYLDRNGVPDGLFKNLVSERSLNGTIAIGKSIDSPLGSTSSNSTNTNSLQVDDQQQANSSSGQVLEANLESRAG